MHSPTLIKNFTAGAAVGANLIVKLGAADGAVLAATASTETLIGVSTELAAASGERCDILLAGVANVIAGGSVTRGNYITSDSAGKAVAIGATGGTNYGVIGIALTSASSGDLFPILIAPSRAQG